MQKASRWLACLLVLLSPFARGAGAAGAFQQMSFGVDGMARTALVYVPARAFPSKL